MGEAPPQKQKEETIVRKVMRYTVPSTRKNVRKVAAGGADTVELVCGHKHVLSPEERTPQRAPCPECGNAEQPLTATLGERILQRFKERRG